MRVPRQLVMILLITWQTCEHSQDELLTYCEKMAVSNVLRFYM